MRFYDADPGRGDSCHSESTLALSTGLRLNKSGSAVANGYNQVMAVMKMIKCPTCIGIGACPDGDVCPTCEGTGEMPSSEVVIDDPCQPPDFGFSERVNSASLVPSEYERDCEPIRLR